jgi:outer membrane protein W
MKQKLPIVFCLFCLLSFAVAQSQSIPKTTIGISGGAILTGSAGANRIAGGRNGVSLILKNSSIFFSNKVKSAGIIPPDGAFTAENKIGMTAAISFNTLVDNNWEVGVSVGKLFGKTKGNFTATVNFDTIPSANFSGTTESDVNGWICELGLKHYFDASFHPFVGAGARYSTQVMANSIIAVNGRSAEINDISGVDEFGGYISGGVKIPLSHSFFFDVEVAGIVRSGTDYAETTSNTVSKISFEPALRIGISFDIGQYFGTERYGGDDEDEPTTKGSPIKK